MKVLVTGGAGYIGSVTVRKLVEAGHQVVVLDNLERGHRRAVDSRARLIEGDLRIKESLPALLAGEEFDAVVHFAGYIESGESMKDPLRFFENNLSAGIFLADFLKGSACRRFIFSSTAGIYGESLTALTENSPIRPTSYYASSKWLFEKVLESLSGVYGFSVVCLRYFNAAGATFDGQLGEAHEPETHLIPLAVKTALGFRPELELFGDDYPTSDGTAVRDYIHVEDLAEAHTAALSKIDRETGSFQVYNVGTGRGYSNAQVIEAVRQVSGRAFAVYKKPRRPGDWAQSFADVTKIKGELGWTARFGLREIVESAYAWHRSHPYGYAK